MDKYALSLSENFTSFIEGTISNDRCSIRIGDVCVMIIGTSQKFTSNVICILENKLWQTNGNTPPQLGIWIEECAKRLGFRTHFSSYFGELANI